MEGNTNDRETSLTSNLNPFRKDGGNTPERQTSLTSNLNPFRKDGGKHE
jgi:hypothetical protein